MPTATRKNYITGVSLEPEVLAYLDQASASMGLSRSWLLNTIVREYLRLAQQHNHPPLGSRESVIRI